MSSSVLELPVHFARTNAGRDVYWPIGKAHVLAVGTTGAGKSSIPRAILSALASEPACQPVGIDLKRVELSYFADRFAALAFERRGAYNVLGQVAELIHARLPIADLLQLRNWPATPRHPFVPLVIDELAELMVGDEARAMLATILRLGRALGVGVLSCTQRGEAGIIGGAEARNNYAIRFAMASLDESSYELGLGVDVAALRALIGRVSVNTPGVGLVLEPGQPVRRARVVWWTDAQVAAAVAAGRDLTVPLGDLIAVARADATQLANEGRTLTHGHRR